MKKQSLLTLVFALLSLTFFLLLVFLRIPSPFYPLMSIQDTIDNLTPLVLIPIYWLMYKSVSKEKSRLGSEIFFMVVASFWVMGQGMHLSANSINNLIGYLARDGVIDVHSTDLYILTYFYDEYLSHYLWHIGVVGLAGLLVYEGWRNPVQEKTDWRMVVPAGILYGFTCFCFFVEGNTLILGIPFVVIVTLLVLIKGRAKLNEQPILTFFFLSCLLAMLMFFGWRLYWGCWAPILGAHC